MTEQNKAPPEQSSTDYNPLPPAALTEAFVNALEYVEQARKEIIRVREANPRMVDHYWERLALLGGQMKGEVDFLRNEKRRNNAPMFC